MQITKRYFPPFFIFNYISPTYRINKWVSASRSLTSEKAITTRDHNCKTRCVPATGYKIQQNPPTSFPQYISEKVCFLYRSKTMPNSGNVVTHILPPEEVIEPWQDPLRRSKRSRIACWTAHIDGHRIKRRHRLTCAIRNERISSTWYGIWYHYRSRINARR